MGSHIRGFGGKKILLGRDYKIRTFLFNFFLTSFNIVCTQFDDDDNWPQNNLLWGDGSERPAANASKN